MDAPRFVPLLPTHGVSPSLSGIRKASIAQPDRLLRPTLFDCPRKALSGLRPAAWPAVSFAAKRIFQSMLSGSRALDPVVLSGVIAVLLPSRFWPASLPHCRLIRHLAVVLECIGGDNRPTLRNSLVSGDPDLARGSEVFYYSSAGFLTVWRGQPSSQ